mmetsp:Transcript_21658/g.74381  ORF Transcript_21658/g.74381 Transcript_21658/m.74381 type:complete len:303 (+) Transcript_21658:257-1165(+)
MPPILRRCLPPSGRLAAWRSGSSWARSSRRARRRWQRAVPRPSGPPAPQPWRPVRLRQARVPRPWLRRLPPARPRPRRACPRRRRRRRSSSRRSSWSPRRTSMHSHPASATATPRRAASSSSSSSSRSAARSMRSARRSLCRRDARAWPLPPLRRRVAPRCHLPMLWVARARPRQLAPWGASLLLWIARARPRHLPQSGAPRWRPQTFWDTRARRQPLRYLAAVRPLLCRLVQRRVYLSRYPCSLRHLRPLLLRFAATRRLSTGARAHAHTSATIPAPGLPHCQHRWCAQAHQVHRNPPRRS